VNFPGPTRRSAGDCRPYADQTRYSSLGRLVAYTDRWPFGTDAKTLHQILLHARRFQPFLHGPVEAGERLALVEHAGALEFDKPV
jgi:hypothetical protein